MHSQWLNKSTHSSNFQAVTCYSSLKEKPTSQEEDLGIAYLNKGVEFNNLLLPNCRANHISLTFHKYYEAMSTCIVLIFPTVRSGDMFPCHSHLPLPPNISSKFPIPVSVPIGHGLQNPTTSSICASTYHVSRLGYPLSMGTYIQDPFMNLMTVCNNKLLFLLFYLFVFLFPGTSGLVACFSSSFLLFPPLLPNVTKPKSTHCFFMCPSCFLATW